MTIPLFSIIIPTLNEEDYLPELLSDLTKQSFQNFEVIVVDGHSIDKTLSLAKEFQNNLPSLKILTSPRRHVCTQRNLGASKAKGEYLLFSDADSRLPPLFLSQIKKRLDSTPTDLLTTFFKPDDQNFFNILTAQTINLGTLIQSTYLLEALFIIKRASFNQLHGFDESINFAEGKHLIKSAKKHHLIIKKYPTPVWIFSFRRFRKYGVFGLIFRSTLRELSDLLKLDISSDRLNKFYPMPGGSFFKKSSNNNFLTQIKNSFSFPKKTSPDK